MVLVKMLMEIDPLQMIGSLVMTLVMISPSQREVSPAEQLRQSPRLIPPRFRLVAAEFRPADELDLLAHILDAKLVTVVCTGLHHKTITTPICNFKLK